MLADPKLHPKLDDEMRKYYERISEGLYYGSLSWVVADEQRGYKLEFPTLGRTLREMQNRKQESNEDAATTRILDEVGEFSSYGSCDSVGQFLAAPLGEWLIKSTRKFAVSFQQLKADDERDGGYRWHKNGGYIGLLGEPECEYLKDEPVIREIFQFHVMEVAS